MRVCGFWVLLFVLGTASTFLLFSRSRINLSIPADEVFDSNSAAVTSTMMMACSRKLKEISGYNQAINKNRDTGKVNLEDYHPIDPVPSSKASIRPGPIQHGSPLIPYIPRKPAPPPQPEVGGSP